MKLLVKPTEPSKLDAHLKTDCLVVPIYDDKKQSEQIDELLKQLGFPLSKRLKDNSISAKLSSCSQVYINTHEVTLLSLGMGKAKELTSSRYRKAMAQAANTLKATKFSKVSWLIGCIDINDWGIEQQTTALSQQLTASSYQFTRCKSNADKAIQAEHTLLVDKAQVSDVKKAIKTGSAVGKGMNLARELGDLPGNICTPNYLAKQARDLAKGSSDLNVKIFSEKQMASLGMHSLLSVSAGSIEPAQLIVMEYNGGAKSAKPHVLVGKGITFDTGGISLKPGASMDEMKYDMCGAASVFGAMQSILELKPKINVVCVIAAAENMPSDRATKPGDIVTSMSGQTIEVLNTDAEGRLVLCDALTYVERYKPKSVIDVATLTGACVVALGKHASGLYSNQDEFAHTLLKAGNIAGDRAWHMPLWDDYQKQLDSNFADMANIGGRDGGSITAACFLSRFAKAYKWAHLDIAGTAWLSGGAKGATGRPVPLLVEYLLNHSS